MLEPAVLLASLIAVPLAFGVIATVLPAVGRALWLPASLAMLTLAIQLATQVAATGPHGIALGGWPAPLGIALEADGLSALMIVITTGVCLGVGWHAAADFDAGQAEGFWPLSWWLMAAMNAAYLATDIFNIYVALELVGLAAVGLVALNREAVAVAAALRYLMTALFGSLAYLMGVALIYGSHGVLGLDAIGALAPTLAMALTVALMTTGLMLKGALFPLHYWLPPAHGSAAAPVSALLSALVVKVAFYLLLRLWFGIFEPVVTIGAAQAVGAAGAAALLWGALAAIRQRKLKMLVAYSTVAQVGYLFLLFPLATGAPAGIAQLAMQGTVLFVFAHALAKSAMFLAAGAIVRANEVDDVDHLEGTSARLPISLFAFSLAGVTLIGLPPSGGFMAKWLLLQSALRGGQWWWAIVILAGGLLTAIYVFRVLRSAFVPPLAERPLATVPMAMQLSALVLALLSVVLGLTATAPLALLDHFEPGRTR